jgi:hypothetical protein
MTVPLLGQAATDRLTELGLSLEPFQAALVVGATNKKNFDLPIYPNSFAGTAAQANIVANLALAYIPKKWTREDPQNIALLVNEQRTLAIAVATGDHRTGSSGDQGPQFGQPKGDGTKELVGQQQLQLFKIETPSTPPHQGAVITVGSKKVTVYYFIFRIDLDREKAFAELSAPTSMEDGQPVAWRERIVLPVLDLRPGPDAMGEPEAPVGTIDVPVVRKNG